MIDYDKAAETAPSTGNLPFLEGDQDCKLLIVDSKNFMGRNGNKYIIKVRVMECSPTGKIESPAKGADRVVMINMDPPKKIGDPDYGMQNLMGYAYALNGGAIEASETQTKGQKLAKLLGKRKIDPVEAQAYRVAPSDEIKAFAIGMIVGDRSVAGATTGTPTNPSHPITYHNWYPLKQTPDELLARKAALAANLPIVWPPPSHATAPAAAK